MKEGRWMNVLYIDAHRGRGYNIEPPREIFKKLV
jgi:hypothetical protein